MKKLGFSLLISFFIICASCAKPPAEQQIRNRLDGLKQAIEDKNTDKIISHLDDDFQAFETMAIKKNQQAYYHKLDKKQLRKIIIVYFLRYKNINVNFTAIHVELDPIYSNKAEVKTSALITGAGGLLPENGRLFAVVSKWHYIDDDWYMSELEWR